MQVEGDVVQSFINFFLRAHLEKQLCFCATGLKSHFREDIHNAGPTRVNVS